MMYYYVSYSGGIGSFLAAHRLKERVDSKRIKLIFCDTKIEDEDLYRFLDESAEKLGLELVKLADGRNPWEVFRDVKLQGNSRIAPCSKILKRDVMSEYLSKAPSHVCSMYCDCDVCEIKPILVLGIDHQESERLERAQKNNPHCTVIAPLCDPPYTSFSDRLDVLKQYDIKPPRLYAMGFPHNNCGGFCVRSGLAQLKLLLQKNRERYLWHEEQQEKLVTENPRLNKPFLRKTIDGVLKYITLKEYRKILEEGCALTGEEQFDFGGCGCFIDV